MSIADLRERYEIARTNYVRESNRHKAEMANCTRPYLSVQPISANTTQEQHLQANIQALIDTDEELGKAIKAFFIVAEEANAYRVANPDAFEVIH